MRERFVDLADFCLHHQLHVHAQLAERAADQAEEAADLGDVVAYRVPGDVGLAQAQFFHQPGLRLHRAGGERRQRAGGTGELADQHARAQLRPRVLVGEFAGAAGTLASLQTGAMQTQAALCAELGLGQPDIAWHTIRDNIAEVGCFLGLVGGTRGKLSMDVKLMMQTEVGEVHEPFAHGRGSSSTMPQKRNPISSCYIHAQVSVVRQHAAALMDAMIADHERSTGPWEIEWIVLPEAFCLMAGALKQSRFVLEGLEVDAKKMRENIDMTGGLVMSEAVMMGLGPYIGREYAHDLVYDICRESVKLGRPLLDLLCEHPEINKHLDRRALAALCDPANYLGQSGVMVDRVLAKLR